MPWIRGPYADACTYRINVVVVSTANFRAFAGDAGYCTDADESIVVSGTSSSNRRRRKSSDVRDTVMRMLLFFVLYGLFMARTFSPLRKKSPGMELGTGQKQFYCLRSQQRCLFAPGLVYLSVYEVPSRLELCENGFFLEGRGFFDWRSLAGEDSAASDFFENNFMGMLLSYFHIGITVGAGVGP